MEMTMIIGLAVFTIGCVAVVGLNKLCDYIEEKIQERKMRWAR